MNEQLDQAGIILDSDPRQRTKTGAQAEPPEPAAVAATAADGGDEAPKDDEKKLELVA